MTKQISVIALTIGIGAILFPATHVAAQLWALRGGHSTLFLPDLGQVLSKVRQGLSCIPCPPLCFAHEKK